MYIAMISTDVAMAINTVTDISRIEQFLKHL